jgi:undecaprenyl-diphosphatase
MTPPRWLWPVLATAVLLSAAAAGEGVLPGDVAVTRAVQDAIPPGLGWLVDAVNWLGRAVPGALGSTLLVALLLLRRGHRVAAGFVALTLPLRLVNPALKALVDSPRPEGTLIAVSERAAGLGFPSGHATGAMLLYGAVILVVPFLTASPYLRAAMRLVAATMILVAGLCRIEVGAHWPSDVVGGYLWGGVLLVVLVTVVGHRRRDADETGRPFAWTRIVGVGDRGTRADT